MNDAATFPDVLANRARWAVECGDCVTRLSALPDGCVHCAVTSPPYFGLRSYLDDGNPDKDLEVGLEETPAAYVGRLVGIFREVHRVLHPSGVVFVNLGDSYANDGKWGGETGGKQAYLPDDTRKRVGRQKRRTGLKPKDLIGTPWMLAFALRDELGFYLRSDIIWWKPSPMPGSMTDRCTSAHEYVFMLTKTPRYFFDAQAIAEPIAASTRARGSQNNGNPVNNTDRARSSTQSPQSLDPKRMCQRETRNKRDVWKIATKGYRGAHFACYPPKLVQPCILAGTSARGVCHNCGEPWRREVNKERRATRPGRNTKVIPDASAVGNRDPQRHTTVIKTVGWNQGCKCAAAEPISAIVLDPFMGSGTTAQVAVEFGRRAIGCELNPKYMPLIHKRMQSLTPQLPGMSAA